MGNNKPNIEFWVHTPTLAGPTLVPVNRFMEITTTVPSGLPGSRYLFNQTLPHPQLVFSVVVPVRDEAQHLEPTLDALRQQMDGLGNPLSPNLYEVLLLANNCTDESAGLARRYQRQHPTFALHVTEVTLPPRQANIGTVRRLLMDEACRRLMSVDNPPGIIASTDGDTVVDSQWLYHIRQAIADGNDAVGGRILTRPDNSPVRLNHLREVTYRTLVARVESVLDPRDHDPWPRHFQHFGASMAVTCSMYQRAGRLPRVTHLEDEAFYRALLRRDAKVRKSPNVRVTTSTRLQGRVAVGFSEQLRYWSVLNQQGQCQLAEPAEAVIIRLRNQGRLRRCWQSAHPAPTDWAPLQSIALQLRLDPAWLRSQLIEAPYFGQLWETVQQHMTAGPWSRIWQPVPITTAIEGLRRFLGREL